MTYRVIKLGIRQSRRKVLSTHIIGQVLQMFLASVGFKFTVKNSQFEASDS